MKDAKKAGFVSQTNALKTQPYTDSQIGTRNLQRTSITYTYVTELLKNTLVMQGIDRCKAGNGNEKSVERSLEEENGNTEEGKKEETSTE